MLQTYHESGAKHLCQSDFGLTYGKNHRLAQILKHERDSGSGIRHGISSHEYNKSCKKKLCQSE